MKPRRDDDDWWAPTFLGNGSVSQLGDAEEKLPPAGRLYVPDPEQRKGWREHYVPAKAEAKPGARPIGFGRR